ncbi:MAG: hypothetical protein EOO38_18590 [Cytophagaceae bacterium]|nr:MAG: hypothetical protein EOO38_18590 [Cytophagaceae bacterium]
MHITEIIAKARAAEVTGVEFKLYSNVDDLGTASNKAITGAIVGTVCFVVLLLLFCAIRRKKCTFGCKSKRSVAEKGQARVLPRGKRTTDDLINEAYRVRLDRNRRTREQAQKAVAAHPSTCAKVSAHGTVVSDDSASSVSSWDIDRVLLAQARAGVNTFEPRSSPEPIVESNIAQTPPIVVEPPTPARPVSQQAEVRAPSPVSPLSETFGPIRVPGGRTYDVSPPDSPGGHDGNGWTR